MCGEAVRDVLLLSRTLPCLLYVSGVRVASIASVSWLSVIIAASDVMLRKGGSQTNIGTLQECESFFVQNSLKVHCPTDAMGNFAKLFRSFIIILRILNEMFDEKHLLFFWFFTRLSWRLEKLSFASTLFRQLNV